LLNGIKHAAAQAVLGYGSMPDGAHHVLALTQAACLQLIIIVNSLPNH
jgi:hypothetical protein